MTLAFGISFQVPVGKTGTNGPLHLVPKAFFLVVMAEVRHQDQCLEKDRDSSPSKRLNMSAR